MITAKLFGTPVVTYNDKEIFFPYSKAKALLFYLLIIKRASRDELSGLFWAESSDEIAKKNLRNAIYQIKKTFGGVDVLLSPNKSIVKYNDAVELKIDTANFETNSDDLIYDYTGEFLQGFFVKNAEGFDEWLTATRENYLAIYEQKLYDLIEQDKNNNSSSKIRFYAEKLIDVNEFNERAYQILMTYYKDKFNYTAAIEVYKKLETLFSKELAMEPSAESKYIYLGILDLINYNNYKQNSDIKSFFYGRSTELRLLTQNYESLTNGEAAKSIVIKGEAGVGKSRLKDEFLSKIDKSLCHVFETSCYAAEKQYFFKPLAPIISEIKKIMKKSDIELPKNYEKTLSTIFPEFSDNKTNLQNRSLEEIMGEIKFDMMGDIISDILERLSQIKNILIVIDDIQYADSMTISTLSSIILHQKRNDIIFLATYRNEEEKNVENMISSLNLSDKLITINLSRFSEKETKSLVKTALPKFEWSFELLNKIYEETSGNAFFIIEYLNIIKNGGDINIMTAKMQDIIKSRFVYLSDDAKKILELASLFDDEVNLSTIKALTNYDEFKLIDILEDLEKKYILVETRGKNGISFKFTHQKLQDFIYMNQSDMRRKISHEKIATILEGMLDPKKINIGIYHKIIYHYEQADSKLKALDYKIKVLNYYLDFSHELFPILNHVENSNPNHTYFTKKETLAYFDDIENSLHELSATFIKEQEISPLTISYLHIKGRYLIREGSYEDGITLIRQMINLSDEISDKDHAIEGYKQLIFYCVQTYKTSQMSIYIDKALNLAVECNYHKEIGILLRLKGLYKLMSKEYQEAESLLLESINTFNITPYIADRYSLNIAAAYNYIGEIRRINKDFAQAIKYYKKAATICKEKNAMISFAIFNVNAGQASYDDGNVQDAKKYFETAHSIYDKLDTVWRKSVASAFLAVIYLKEKNYEKALHLIKEAERDSQKIQNPHEMGTVFYVKALIKSELDINDKKQKLLAKYLKEDLDSYIQNALAYLTESGDNFEIETLNKLES